MGWLQLVVHQESIPLSPLQAPRAWQAEVESGAGAESTQSHLSAGQKGVGAKQFVTHQAAMEESPAQAPTATQVWPAPGAGEFPGAGVDASGGAAVATGMVGGGRVGRTITDPPIEMSAHALKCSCGPSPSPPTPSGPTPQLFPAV